MHKSRPGDQKQRTRNEKSYKKTRVTSKTKSDENSKGLEEVVQSVEFAGYA